MSHRLRLVFVALVGLAVLAAYPALSSPQGKGKEKPNSPILLKAAFMAGNIQNGIGVLPVGNYAYFHTGEGGRDVHVRILEPVEYGPLQMYIPCESGSRVNIFFDWPPASIAVPNPKACGWPGFLWAYKETNLGTQVYSPTVFLFRTRNKIVTEETWDEDGNLLPPILKDTGAYLNLSKMGADEEAMAAAEIHFHDDSDRWWWFGKMNTPVLVKVTKFTTRPEEWTITPIQIGYLGWDIPGAYELGSPNINKKAATEWWCAFGVWRMPFELRIARLQ